MTSHTASSVDHRGTRVDSEALACRLHAKGVKLVVTEADVPSFHTAGLDR